PLTLIQRGLTKTDDPGKRPSPDAALRKPTRRWNRGRSLGQHLILSYNDSTACKCSIAPTIVRKVHIGRWNGPPDHRDADLTDRTRSLIHGGWDCRDGARAGRVSYDICTCAVIRDEIQAIKSSCYAAGLVIYRPIERSYIQGIGELERFNPVHDRNGELVPYLARELEGWSRPCRRHPISDTSQIKHASALRKGSSRRQCRRKVEDASCAGSTGGDENALKRHKTWRYGRNKSGNIKSNEQCAWQGIGTENPDLLVQGHNANRIRSPISSHSIVRSIHMIGAGEQ